MAKAPHSFDFFYNDFLGGCDHLTNEEVACYLRLLIYQWQNGHIPIDPLQRMNLCRVTDVGSWERTWRHLLDKFIPIDGSEIVDSESLANRTVFVNLRMHLDRQKHIPAWKHRCFVNAQNAKGSTKQDKKRQKRIANESLANREGGRGKGEEGKTIKKSATLSYSDQFEKFWSAYPSVRKTDKRRAWDAWQKSIRSAEPESIIAAAVEYASSDRGRGEYSKQPATWLNGACWDDDRAAWRDDTAKKQTAPKFVPMKLSQINKPGGSQ